MGSTTITRGHSQQTGNSNHSILRYYDIAPSNNSGLNASISFIYNENELNGIPEADLRLFSSDDGGTNWTYRVGTVSSAENMVSLSGIDGFSRWTLGNVNALMPVELLAFTASVYNATVTLKWKTASETNNFGYEIERTLSSGELRNWVKTGFVEGAGSSASEKEYLFEDRELNAGIYYYRLKQVDTDGSFTYSPVAEAVVSAAPTEFNLNQNYPNPFNPETMIEFSLSGKGTAVLKVFNSIGEEVAELFTGDAEAGKIYRVNFNGSTLSSGFYYAKLQFEGKQRLIKMLYLK